jgi:outer membrane receptor protein involved in Fe transport
MRIISKIGFYFLMVLFASGVASAQTYEGRILGTVLDSTGGTVLGAKVQITNVDNGVSRNLESNEAGEYVAPNLQPGLYTITVQAAGFKKIQRTGIRLEVGKEVRIDFAMQAGGIEETVRVTEDVPLIETTNDTLGGSFANKSINDLPLNGRDYQNLVVLRPGVQRGPGGGFLSISSNGNRPEDNNFIFDGADNNDPYYGVQMINTEGVQGTPGSILPIDAIQEFNTVENPPAEYGWKPGAIINLGIKSGTNELHGTTYYFARNNWFDARNFFDAAGTNPGTGLPLPQKAVRQHQFGGSLGGPIIKNKTFIFGAYEGVRALVANSDVIPTPSAVSLGGDPTNSIPDALRDLMAHSASGGPATFACAGVPVNTLALNSLSANLIGCGAFTKNGAYPGLLPNNTTQSTNFATGFPNQNRGDNFVIKADHHFNANHILAGRYFFGDSLQQEQDIPVRAAEWRSQSKIKVQVFGANYNWIISPRLVNEVKFGYNRFWQTILTLDNNKDPLATYGINSGVSAPNLGMPTIIISGFGQSTAPTLGGNKGWPLETIPDETYVFSDSISYTRGRHTFRFGGEFRRGKTDNLRNREGKGLASFSGGVNPNFPLTSLTSTSTTSTPLEDFLSGFPSSGQIFVGNTERHVSMNSYGAFFQDDWRVTDHLTVNAGLRYDLSLPIKERKNLLGNFDPVKGLQQVGVNTDSPYNADYKNFGPRLGVAWDPRGNAKTVIRTGFGMIYEIPHFAAFIGQNGVNNGATTGLNVIPTGTPGAAIQGGTIVGASPSVTPTWTAAGPVFPQMASCSSSSPCDILGVRRNLRTPYAMSWNLNIQQALGNLLSLQVGYVGNRGVQLYSVRDINQVDPFSAVENSATKVTDPLTGTILACNHCEQAGRPFNLQFPFLRFINFMENNYTSIYHGLQTSLTQRAWHGFSYVLGYTWSHSIDDASLNRAPQPQNSFRPDLERGSSDLDVRNRFTLSTTYDVPGRKGYGQLLEGWQVNSIIVLQGGLPWTAFDFNDDVSKTGEFSDRWNLKPGVNVKDVPGFTLNKPYPISTFFQQPTCPPCFGNMGRNIFRGPHYRNWDFSLVKNFRITERFNAQLRGEFFNILNHPNLGIPGSLLVNAFNNDFSSPGSFGQVPGTPDVVAANPVIGTGGARNIQLGLKFRF